MRTAAKLVKETGLTLPKTKAKKRKPKTIARLVEEAAVLLQKLVRIKAADRDGIVTCVTCGKRLHWKEAQGGHFISRKWISTKLLEENIHPQCALCNGPLHGNMIQYTLYMTDTYGRDFVDELQRMKHDVKKYTRPEIEDIIGDLKAKIDDIWTTKKG